jgi:hypothetical protein
MAYHVRGCMAFRSNELGLALIMSYFVRARQCRTRVWPFGWRGTPQRSIFISSHEKCIFHFQSAKFEFFCEATTLTTNQKLRITYHINIRTSEVRISALVLMRKPSKLFSGFCASSYRFCWNQCGFAL